MICYLHYISAFRRLQEVEKTVMMLQKDKYSERDVPEMVLAQRDFIKKEKEYFAEQCIDWNFIILFLTIFFVFGFVIYSKIFA